MTDLEQRWIANMKQTIAAELARGMQQGIPPKGLVELLWGIPEVEEAMLYRAELGPRR